MSVVVLNLSMCVPNVLFEGTVSQIDKKRVTFGHFLKVYFVDLI